MKDNSSNSGRPNVAGMDRDELKALLLSMKEPAFRSQQVFEGLNAKRWTCWEEFTMLSKPLRKRLEEEVDLQWPQICGTQTSSDGSAKHVFRLMDGNAVEGVHMPFQDRSTLCLSSQVGCAMGCTFCATGQMGLIRHLEAGEIVGQVIAMLNHHRHPEGRPVNLVFMGMGEPLHNLENVMKAFAILTDAKGLAIPPRRITLSTAGLVSGIEKLATYPRRPRLALSLNATTDEYRSRIMPVNRTWNLEALANALRAFPLAKGEKITLEYVLLKGATDSLEDAGRLALFAGQFPSKVNLIPFNEHEGAGFETPDESRLEEFLRFLATRKITVSVRRSRGQDIGGACGQLVQEIGAGEEQED